MALCTTPRCLAEQAFAPVVNVPAKGKKRGDGMPLKATLTAQAKCRECIQRVTLPQLLSPTVKHMLTLTLKEGDPPPDFDRAWITAVDIHSPQLAELRMKAAEGGHA